jgi:spermidine/putrescine transport system ATP-binding protein
MIRNDPPAIGVHHVVKRFGNFTAVDHVSLDIARGEFFSLLGASGCGKTTLLRMIAGFEQPTTGDIFLDGSDATSLPPHRRPVNLVFQHFALFPHLTVAKNVAFGLRYEREPKPATSAVRSTPSAPATLPYQSRSTGNNSHRVAQALELVQLSGLEARYPHELSGGQKQRVALARALILRPKVLLLDEPLGALDQKLRKTMQVELKALQRTLGITFVFVTHDQEEALTMSDRIAVMNAGRIEQCDLSSTIFEYPQTEFVAQFMGAANFFSAVVTRLEPPAVCLTLSTGTATRAPLRDAKYAPGDSVRFMVRPEKLSLTEQPSASPFTAIEVQIEQRLYQGLSTVWTVRDAAGAHYTVYEQNTSPFENTAVRSDSKRYLCWNPDHAVLMNPTPPST